jgi:probable rRNA maturation factor
MSISFHYQIPFKLKHVNRIKQLLNTTAEHECHPIISLSVVFVSDEEMLQLNRNFLQHDYYTDILTFDLGSSSMNSISGELYISLHRAKENAEFFNVSLDNEIHRLLIHGVLHLCGYSDDTKESKNQMSLKEDYYLSLF